MRLFAQRLTVVSLAVLTEGIGASSLARRACAPTSNWPGWQWKGLDLLFNYEHDFFRL
jgi:hypothetical protein